MKNFNFEEEDIKMDKMITRKITEILDYRGLHIKDLGEFVGKSMSTASNWRSNRHKPYAVDILMLAKYTELDIRYFFEEEMPITEADLKIRKSKREDALFFFKRILFEKEEEFSPERSALADTIIRLPEEKLEKVQKIIDIYKSEKIDKNI